MFLPLTVVYGNFSEFFGVLRCCQRLFCLNAVLGRLFRFCGVVYPSFEYLVAKSVNGR